MAAITETQWDYIIAGGGLTGSVVANRLLEHDGKLKILILEAGGNPLTSEEVLKPNPGMMLIGSDFDWNISSVPQKNVDNRAIALPQGKGLGGGTVINAGGWIRGHKIDYDAWGEAVGDKRWSYDGLLPFMKKVEKYPHASVNPDQHGYEGKALLQTVTSSNRPFPLREKVVKSWAALGVEALPHFDANAGNSLGIGEVSENRDSGRRELAASIYSLDGITVKTETAVQKVLLDKQSNGSLKAVGVQLADGTEVHGRQVILAAGAIRTPQLLKLSGIGPADELAEHGIPVQVESPEVGKNLADHTVSFTGWKFKNPADGWAIGSPNQLFAQPQYTWGVPADFLVTTTAPKDGLAKAIEADEGAKPDPSTHPLLKQDIPFFEYLMVNAGAPDGSAAGFGCVVLQLTSRGTVKLASANVKDSPLVDPNYLGTEVDRYLHREILRRLITFAASDKTEIGRDILEGEMVPPGVEPLSVTSTDESIDARARGLLGTCFHPHGTAAMGKVVDTNLKVNGVENLRIVDASVIPVNLATHLQVPAYALAEQAAAIIISEKA